MFSLSRVSRISLVLVVCFGLLLSALSFAGSPVSSAHAVSRHLVRRATTGGLITVTTAAQAAHFGVAIGSIIGQPVPTPHCYQTTPAIRKLALENKLSVSQMESYGFPAKWEPTQAFYDAVTHDITHLCLSEKIYRLGWHGETPSAAPVAQTQSKTPSKTPGPLTITDQGCVWHATGCINYAGYGLVAGDTADPTETWTESIGEFYWPYDQTAVGPNPPGQVEDWSTWVGMGGPSCADSLLQSVALWQDSFGYGHGSWFIEDDTYFGNCKSDYHNQQAAVWTVRNPVYDDRFTASVYSDAYATLQDYTASETFSYTSSYSPYNTIAICSDESSSGATVLTNEVDETVFFNCNGIDESSNTYYVGDSAHTTKKFYIEYPTSSDDYFVPTGITHGEFYGTFYVSCEQDTFPPTDDCLEA